PLAQLDRLGTVQGGRAPAPQLVGSIAEASAKVGFTVKTPDPATVPAGLDKTPKIRVLPAHDVRFTFDEVKAREYMKELGRDNAVFPTKFNGAKLVVSFPAAVALQYAPPGAEQPTKGTPGTMLLVGESKEITAGVEG